TPEFYMSKYHLERESRSVRMMTFLEKVSMTFADHVITISHPIEDLFVSRGLPRQKSTIIMNSADESRFASAPQTAPDPEKFVMVYHGTLTHIYGLDIAIEAFALVHDKMPGAELWILGSGTEKDALGKLAAQLGLTSKVKVVGQVPPAEIPTWLGQCHAG